MQAVVDKIMVKTSIFLDDVRFHAFHGVMPQERAVGADFTVSLNVGYDFVKAAESDDITDGTKAAGKKCPVCGQETLVYQEGCLICTNCGASRCG